jgi:hypothetical protein
MPYERVCKVVQIRPPRKYTAKSAGRIARYALKSDDRVKILGSVMKQLGFNVCNIAKGLSGIVNILDYIRNAVVAVASSIAIQQMIVILSRPFILKVPLLNRIVVLLLIVLTAIKTLVEYLETTKDIEQVQDILTATINACEEGL